MQEHSHKLHNQIDSFHRSRKYALLFPTHLLCASQTFAGDLKSTNAEILLHLHHLALATAFVYQFHYTFSFSHNQHSSNLHLDLQMHGKFLVDQYHKLLDNIITSICL